ncbi:hypothetical protein PAL_GLEAN10011552 [Pteropus alecto]|uniref:Uncharacterized protein n=1 Tax=Pteropus alecto TaxID=9402 RepID=L5KQ94_PTEAL|nr:hypothetical protein PAL_GLEAN10011552 [Pteropus alecto]
MVTTLIPDEVLSDSEVYQNGRQRFAPHWGTAPDWWCAKSREARKAMKDGVLRLSKSAKPLCEDTATRLPTSTGGLRLLSKKMENSSRVFYVSEDGNFQEYN